MTPITLFGEAQEKVITFTYLSSIFDKQGEWGWGMERLCF